MAGANRKKSSKKRESAQKSSKYVIPDPSPVRTRSKSSTVDEIDPRNKLPSSQPSVPPLVAENTTPPPMDNQSPDAFQLVKALEERWDCRFSKMETAIRTGLSQNSSSQASVSAPAAAAVTPAAVPSTAPVAVASSSEKSKKLKKKRKSRRRSPSLDSSSEESDYYQSSSAESDSSSDSETEEVSSSKASSKRKSKKKGKYDASRYLDEGDKIDSFSRLILANLRMVLKLFKKKRNLKGLLQHLIMVVEKADTGMFANDSLCRYDEAMRKLASEKDVWEN